MGLSLVLTDLYGNVHGEITQATDRVMTLPHKRVPTLTFSMPLWDSLANIVMDQDTLVKAYYSDPVTGTKTLAFIGPVVSAEESGEALKQSIAVSAAGPMWRLSKRLIPASKTPSGVLYGTGVAPIDLGLMAKQIIDDCNGADFTGIATSTGNITTSISGYIGNSDNPIVNKNAAEQIAELSNGLGSFEPYVQPTEPTAYANPRNWPRIGLFYAAPMIGSSKPEAIFEYGTKKANVQSYKRGVTRDTMINNAVISVSGWPKNVDKDANGNDLYAQIEVPDNVALTARGLFEDLIPDNGILDAGLRTSLANFHLAIRKAPRNQITFTPALNARPRPFTDYVVGDTVRARAVVRDSVRFDAMFRIWGMTFSVDQNGNENLDLELVRP